MNRLFDRDIAAEIRDSWEAYIPKIIRLAESEHDNHALQAARSTVGEYASDGTSIYFWKGAMHLVQIYLSCHVNVFLLYFCLHLLAHSITEQTGGG